MWGTRRHRPPAGRAGPPPSEPIIQPNPEGHGGATGTQGGGGGTLTGSAGQVIFLAEVVAKQWLQNPDCRALFGNGADPAAILQSLSDSGSAWIGLSHIRELTVNLGPWSSGLQAFTYPNVTVYGTGLIFPGADISINSASAAALGAIDPKQAITAFAETFVEELGHAYNFVPGSGGSSVVYDGLLSGNYLWQGVSVSASLYNYDMIMTKCNK